MCEWGEMHKLFWLGMGLGWSLSNALGGLGDILNSDSWLKSTRGEAGLVVES